MAEFASYHDESCVEMEMKVTTPKIYMASTRSRHVKPPCGAATPPSSSSSSELDPLLRDLVEKKLSLKMHVISMAAELKDARDRLASHELNDKDNMMSEGEFPVNNVAEQFNHHLHESRDPSRGQCKYYYSLRTESDTTDAFATAGCHNVNEILNILYDVATKNRENINQDLVFEDERVMHRYWILIFRYGDTAYRKSIGVSKYPIRIGTSVQYRCIVAEECMRVVFEDEHQPGSALWENKIKDLESQLGKHRRAVQELKGRLLKLEFCIQEQRPHLRKLQSKL
ncbi:hypothetical protein U9M48_020085 [Paspalum notatum var. saurae]|uniref:Uncharacterized protein n=1 Tax=Paspalum notatum var. saurae TaxID=547442 RepID=A0AAQ3WRM5_PASNO